jgi:hypothetical protein
MPNAVTGLEALSQGNLLKPGSGSFVNENNRIIPQGPKFETDTRRGPAGPN